MKKSLLLLMLLPFIGFTQTNLVRWNNTSTPAPDATGITATTLTTNGTISLQNDNWSGFRFQSSPNNNNNLDYNEYTEFTVTVGSGYALNPSGFSLTYNSPNGNEGPKNLQVRYSTSPSFTSNGTLLQSTQTLNRGSSNNQISLSFPTGYSVLENTTLYIRIYTYGQPNKYYKDFYIRNTTYNGSTQGPTLTGTVSPYSTVLNAVDDAYTININNSGNFSVLANDIAGSSAINYMTLGTPASHGTAVVNGNNTITYTPSSGYSGTDSFTYTIGNGVDPNDTATVNIIVEGTTPTGSLNGTYYVGTNGHFTTITAAVNHLNSNGVSGPVTFILKNVLYNNASGEIFPITINNFTGSSAVNTVTFKPNKSVNVRIEATNVNHYTGVPAVFKLNGADYIVFDGSNDVNDSTRNLIIKNNSDIDYTHRSVIWIASNGSNGATNNTIKYCKLRQEYKNDGGNFCVGVYSGSNQSGNNNAFSAATADNANLKVIGNDFMNVKQGVYIEGNATTRTTNVVIHQNDLGSENNTETIIQPAYLSNVNGFEYNDNYVYNLYRDTNSGDLRSAGIHVANNTTDGSILRNNMRDLTRTTTDSHTFAGITLASTNNSSNILVANNFILNVIAQGNSTADENGHGININSGGGYKIYHNTVVLNTNQPSNGYSSALYVHSSVNGSLDVRNNIFINNQTTGTRRTAILVNKSLSSINSLFSHLDYNNYYSNDKIGFISSAGSADWPANPDYQTTLSGWQSFTGKDTNSISELPVFVSANDLHLAGNDNDAINNLGTPIATITKDIDGQIRNTDAPDMGADEFGPIQMPAPGSGDGVYCDNSVTWDGAAWIGGEPTANTDVIFAGDFTQNGGTLYACSVFVIDGANVLFENESNAIVTHSVNVEDGSALTFENSCNLIQIEDTANEGTVTIKRNSSMIKRLDYTIWSSPVTGTQTLLDFSPQTLTNRFYDFNTAENLFFSIADPASTLFEKAHGYLIRVANNHSSSVPSVYHGEFVGTPNNGTVRVAMEYTNGDESYKMVGNPYSSPINVKKFIDANIDNIEGTLWVWRKTNDPTKTTYCTINKIGWVANNAPGGGGENGDGGNQLIENPFNIIEDGVLNTGQGFFVRALNDNEIVFRNNMRETVNYNNFFRSENNASEAQQDIDNQTNRYWLNVVTEDETVFSQTLIAHSALATEGYDNGYDGRAFLDGDVSLYTILDGATEEESLKLSIQSRGTFAVTDTVKIGFETEIAGTFSFTIDHMDGLFADGQALYLVDKLTNTTYNLAEGDYTFNSEIGTFDNRFQIIYSIEGTLDTNNPQFNDSEVVVYQNNNELSINAPQNIESVVVYDLLGKVLYQNQKVDNSKFTATLNIQQQVAIVMITLENNQVVSKKVMIN
ncbi:hypothetical protein E0W68_13075 [Flavobacterium salilacus subsp. salilacus]|uniref:Ig-like domain-containing protein n=1 Tax=Flavobacterium TaxID=237 RepID=UPI0010755F91|nr:MULTISPECIES: Ig-like domain-containing protein [Flavobacterium]KAF2515462.1 hypothetical protein E0W68_13075 [Flavobacterium salilacus subsp. salilacus]MBE1615860.1 cadherin-like domain-containing protein [Flavobacterium sp. SaA2.13]